MTKILLAEDDQDVRHFLRDELTDHNFKVTAVGNGAEAIVAAVDEPYDLYVLDMMMPGMDGIQTIRVLRKVTPAVPILGLTGHVGQGYMSQASAYGVTCLSKPIRIEELIREIEEITNPKKTA
ncbi:MAG TPA: response regulator [Anaerolineales bacterium]|nr:response regulator [Anaerolineales bacterium]